jgi:hypothetical protein
MVRKSEVSRRCVECASEFLAGPPNKLTCSKECANKSHRRSTREWYDERSLQAVCAGCGGQFAARNARVRFCGKSCAARTNNRLYPKRVALTGSCRHCGSKIQGERMFCDGDCYAASVAAKRTSRMAPWIAGEVSASGRNGNLLASARDYLLDSAGHKCSQCGWGVPNPRTGRPILTVDHIDGDWTNNFIANLRVICYNCHTLTETFCSLNDSSPGARFYVSPKVIRLAMERGVFAGSAA